MEMCDVKSLFFTWDNEKTRLDFNYIMPCFDLLQFIYNYVTRFCNLNLDIKSDRKTDRKSIDRQTDKDWLTDKD